MARAIDSVDRWDDDYFEEPSVVFGVPVTLRGRKDGKPIRPVLNGRRSRPVWNYYSLKCGTGLPCESGNELHALYHAEVSTDVVRYRVQPFTLRFVIDGRVRPYTPDLEEVLADGRVRITEVKESFEADADPEYAQKLVYAAAYCQAKGQVFRTLERADIEARPAFDSVDVIQGFRRTAVTIDDVMRLHERFAESSALALAEAREIFASAPLGFAKLAAMMVRRIISLDLAKPLSPMTPVQLLNRTTQQTVG